MNGYASHAWDELAEEAAEIVAGAEQRGVPLRVLGSAGIRLHCSPPGKLMDSLGRPPRDIDLVVPETQCRAMRRYLESRGYVADRDLLIAMEGTRYNFTHSERGTEIDVFVERLNFCHTIDVTRRLHRHPVTLPVEELVLAKLQMVEMTITDVMDVGVILGTHRVRKDDADGALADTGPFDPEAIDAKHIAGLLARDWGFHHTATRNLRRIGELVRPSGAVNLGPEPNVRVADGVRRLLAFIDAEPKSLRWRARDKIGERKKWWHDVDEKGAASSG
jgi:hypothetical protein